MHLNYTYTRIHVTNFEACQKFYQDVLGLKVTFEGDRYTTLLALIK